MDATILNEAYARFSDTGPEWGEDQLTNHGPMAAEVLVRRGYAADVHRWVDAYLRRLDRMPASVGEVTDDTWQEALGDGRRVGAWTEYFTRQVAEQPWQQVLAAWWPRLLPGIAAGATHGVIRTGHAVRALLDGAAGPEATTEMAHGLAFWAARAQAVPGATAAAGRLDAGTAPAGSLDAAAALDGVPRIATQSGRVADRFGQLQGTAGWAGSLAAMRRPATADEARTLLEGLVDRAAARYLGSGHASPVLLVHTATAPNAVLHTLPALPRELWAPSLAAVWAVTAAITAAYAPRSPAASSGSSAPSASSGPDAVAEVIDRAATHGDEHVIKFTDTAAEAYLRSGDPDALAAAIHIGQLIAPPGS